MMPRSLPIRTNQSFDTQTVGEELVVFDRQTGRAVCLNRMATRVWQLSDGQHSPAEMAEELAAEFGTAVPEPVIAYALAELTSKQLLEPPAPTLAAPALSRRALVTQLGARAALLLPLAGLVAVPRRANASGTGGGGGGGCVLADTPVALADGRLWPASGIQPGDWLRTLDARTGALLTGQVADVVRFEAPAIHTLYTEAGDVLEASPSHLLIAGLGDVDGTALAGLGAGGTVLRLESGVLRPTRIIGIHRSPVGRPVFGIEMHTPEHTLLTAGLASHNLVVKFVQRPGQSGPQPVEVPDGEGTPADPDAQP